MPRADVLFWKSFNQNAVETGRILQWLFLAQWLFVVLLAVFVTPRTWIGATPQVQIHQIVAVVMGGLLAAGPWWLIRAAPSQPTTRYIAAVSQLLFSVVIIHITGGRIESHFHIFGSLAILSFYRDWKVIAVATAVTAVDHIVRGLFLPQSIYGLADLQLFRSWEHVGWIVVESAFLVVGIRNQLGRMHEIARTKGDWEEAQERTTDLLNRTVEQLNTGSRLTTSAEEALTMVNRIRESLENLVSTEQVVDSANHDINNAAHRTQEEMVKLAEQATDQASHVAESSASIEEMVANITNVNQIVQRQSQNIDGVNRDVSEAQQAARLLSETIERLGNAGNQIHKMVGVIANVASQTQLLAMNAAIEAAHAGESGRGFSVVAGEIRNLSEQTSAEVNQIKAQVNTIVSSIDDARGAVERTASSYKSAADGFSDVRQAFSQIAAANSQLDEGGREILQAVSALQDITHTVRDLSQETRETQSGVTTAATTLDHARLTLSRVTAEITESIEAISRVVQATADVAASLEAQLEMVAQHRG